MRVSEIRVKQIRVNQGLGVHTISVMGSIVEKSYYCYGPHYEIGVAHTVGLCIVQKK